MRFDREKLIALVEHALRCATWDNATLAGMLARREDRVIDAHEIDSRSYVRVTVLDDGVNSAGKRYHNVHLDLFDGTEGAGPSRYHAGMHVVDSSTDEIVVTMSVRAGKP